MRAPRALSVVRERHVRSARAGEIVRAQSAHLCLLAYDDDWPLARRAMCAYDLRLAAQTSSSAAQNLINSSQQTATNTVGGYGNDASANDLPLLCCD